MDDDDALHTSIASKVESALRGFLHDSIMLMGGGFLQAPPSFPSQQALLSHSRPTRSLRAETIRQPQATSSNGCGINHTAACPLTSDAFSNLTILLSSQIPASESSANRLGQGADRSLLDCSTAPPYLCGQSGQCRAGQPKPTAFSTEQRGRGGRPAAIIRPLGGSAAAAA